MSATSDALEALEMLERMRAQTQASNQYIIAWSCLLIWDWLATLPVEVEHIWLKKKTPLKIMFLANRYGTIILNTTSAGLILTNVPQRICDKMFWIETFCLIYVLVITDVLLAFRVFAIYDRSRICAVVLTLLVGAELSVLLASASHVKPLDLPQSLRDATNTMGCLAADPQGDFAVLALGFSFAPFITNVLLLGAMVFRNWQITRQLDGIQLPILSRMVRDGTFYSVSITLVNIVNIYFYIQPNECIKSFNICAVVVASSALSCRLVLSLLVRKPDSTSGVFVSQVSVCKSSADVCASTQRTRLDNQEIETIVSEAKAPEEGGMHRRPKVRRQRSVTFA
ncbi:hypothetical protein JCM16303_005021 [Sporobolomyces ruberrimus]